MKQFKYLGLFDAFERGRTKKASSMFFLKPQYAFQFGVTGLAYGDLSTGA